MQRGALGTERPSLLVLAVLHASCTQTGSIEGNGMSGFASGGVPAAGVGGTTAWTAAGSSGASGTDAFSGGGGVGGTLSGGAGAGAVDLPGGAGTGGAGTAGTTPTMTGETFVSDVSVAVHEDVNTILVVTWTQAVAADETFLQFSFDDATRAAPLTSRPQP
jgi:hypothetical protein